MRTKEVKFRITRIDENGWIKPLAKVGDECKGILNLNTNAILWNEGNSKSFVFWVGKTCEIIK